jgi:hypothetical protein
MKTLSLLTVVAAIASPSFAEDVRQAESHEHGVGQLDIAFEATTIAMELHAPGADIVGFEYAATSKDDHNAIDAAVAVLSKPFDLFGLPVDAGCKAVNAMAELEGDEAHDDEHDDDHKEEDHSDHNDHDEDEGHAEFHAEYLFECSNLSAVTEITLPYFDAFPNAKELELQVVSEKGASAFEIERDEPSVNLSELF